MLMWRLSGLRSLCTTASTGASLKALRCVAGATAGWLSPTWQLSTTCLRRASVFHHPFPCLRLPGLPGLSGLSAPAVSGEPDAASKKHSAPKRLAPSLYRQKRAEGLRAIYSDRRESKRELKSLSGTGAARLLGLKASD